MKTKLYLSALVLVAVAGSQPARAFGCWPNGVSLNGILSNGLTFNGVAANGCSSNGVTLTGAVGPDATAEMEKLVRSERGTFGGAEVVSITLPDGSSLAVR